VGLLAGLLSLLIVVTPIAAIAQQIDASSNTIHIGSTSEYVGSVLDAGMIQDSTVVSLVEIQNKAAQDAESDAHTSGYFIAGCALGIIGWVIAIASDPEVPSERLLTLNANQLPFYMSAYKEKMKSKNTKAACTGWGISAGVAVAVYAVAFATLANK
jgi:hypothetical protein